MYGRESIYKIGKCRTFTRKTSVENGQTDMVVIVGLVIGDIYNKTSYKYSCCYLSWLSELFNNTMFTTSATKLYEEE